MTMRLIRQSFLGAGSDEALAGSRVGIVGLGGGGSHVAQQLAHVGIGNFVLFDSDGVEHHNLNRLIGATAKDAERGAAKVVALRRLIKGINSKANVSAIRKRWQEEPLTLRDCDVVFGCVDSYGERDQLERACRRFLIPYIDIGMDVTPGTDGFVISGQVILSMPGELCMWCLGFLNEKLLGEEAAQYGAAGGRPQVVWPNGVLASTAVGTFVQIITPWQQAHRPTIYLEYDGNAHTLVPSNRLEYVKDKRCSHFSSATDLGYPFWSGCELKN
jgi:hypothetical protein